MKHWRRGLDVAVNVALLSCCVLLALFLLRGWNNQNRPDTKKPQDIASLVGKTLPANLLNRSAKSNTLILVLQEGCRYCEETMPFYRRIATQLSGQSKTHLMALLPTTMEQSAAYLNYEDLSIQDVKQATLRSLGVSGTPTLLLTDSAGMVVEQWNGKLPPEAETKVLMRIMQ